MAKGWEGLVPTSAVAAARGEVKYLIGRQYRPFSKGEGGVGGVVVAATAAGKRGTIEEGARSRVQL